MELPQCAPTESTLFSFIKTFLCPELSSWLHQTPAEAPPVFLAAQLICSASSAFPGQASSILWTSVNRCGCCAAPGQGCWLAGQQAFLQKRWHLQFYADSLWRATPAWHLSLVKGSNQLWNRQPAILTDGSTCGQDAKSSTHQVSLLKVGAFARNIQMDVCLPVMYTASYLCSATAIRH